MWFDEVSYIQLMKLASYAFHLHLDNKYGRQIHGITNLLMKAVYGKSMKSR